MLNPLLHTPWNEDIDLPNFNTLEDHIHCDVCVIGAGIAGLTTAYLLSQKGKKVCVLESLAIGEGQTAQTTAHVTIMLDSFYSEIIRIHGLEKAQLVAESHKSALHKIEEIVASESIDCDLLSVNGFLCTSNNNDDREKLEQELYALHQVGCQDAHFQNTSPLPSFTSGPCLIIPNQWQIHPLKYLRGIVKALVRQGVQIYCHSPVHKIHTHGDLQVVTTAGYSVQADSVVVATNTPINNTFALHTKQMAYRTYVVAFKVPKNRVAMELYWDTENPYHYLRVQPYTDTHDLFIVGGEDHKTGQHDRPQDCFKHLIDWTLQRFPFVGEVVHRWSGQVMETLDGLPYLGHNPMDNKNVYVITGHAGVGMAQSTIGAMLITDQILGFNNPWEETYKPSRFSFRALGEYFKENLNTAAQYGDWFSPQALQSINELKRDEGMVVNHGLRKVAVYNSGEGIMSFYSAACPHLGGVLHWNSVEKSWDCPCHGSRFSCHGKVIEGPAVDDLEIIDDIFNRTLQRLPTEMTQLDLFPK